MKVNLCPPKGLVWLYDFQYNVSLKIINCEYFDVLKKLKHEWLKLTAQFLIICVMLNYC